MPVADACGRSYQAVRKWEKAGKLPRTEFSGETQYAAAIAKVCKNKVTKRQLLSMRGLEAMHVPDRASAENVRAERGEQCMAEQ